MGRESSYCNSHYASINMRVTAGGGQAILSYYPTGLLPHIYYLACIKNR